MQGQLAEAVGQRHAEYASAVTAEWMAMRDGGSGAAADGDDDEYDDEQAAKELKFADWQARHVTLK